MCTTQVQTQPVYLLVAGVVPRLPHRLQHQLVAVRDPLALQSGQHQERGTQGQLTVHPKHWQQSGTTCSRNAAA